MTVSPVDVQLSLQGDARVGAPLAVRITITNTSPRPVTLVGVIDGSEDGFRFPHYIPRVGVPAGAEVVEQGEMVDMAAPLRAEDFHVVAPGESFDPTDARVGRNYLPISAFQLIPTTAGEYEFQLTVSTESEDADRWLGVVNYPGNAAVIERLRTVARFTAVSNTLRVEVPA